LYSEADFCTVIVKSLDLGFKIPDPTSDFEKTVKRVFDGFGVLQGVPIYWEAKLTKGLKSLNLQEIREHQIDALIEYKKALPNCHAWIIWCVTVKAGEHRVYIFEDPFEIKRRRDNKENILKKELVTLPYKLVKKGKVDF